MIIVNFNNNQKTEWPHLRRVIRLNGGMLRQRYLKMKSDRSTPLEVGSPLNFLHQNKMTHHRIIHSLNANNPFIIIT
jgi:hypothetical protein